MWEYVERWLPERKSLLVLPVVLVLTVGTGWWLQSPQPETKEGRSPGIQEQWRKLLPLRAPLQNVGSDEAQIQVFSPVDLPITGAALIAWRPMEHGGEMQLEVNWQAVPALFSWLARCGMRVTAFSLRPEKRALWLVLQLEVEDAL